MKFQPVTWLAQTIFLSAFITKASAVECDAEYERIGDQCYRLYDPTSFVKAQLFCWQEDGNLASIHNEQVEKYIEGLGKEILIGLQYKNNTFEWSDGTALDYSKLSSDFAEWIDYLGNCVKISEGKWTNAKCYEDMVPFVCQKKARDFPVTPADQCPDGNTVFKDSGSLYSPGYPELFNGSAAPGLECTYRLAAKMGEKVVLEFQDVDFKDSSNYIEIHDGWTQTNYSVISVVKDFNGKKVFKTQLSNLMLVKFVGHSSGEWEAKWYSEIPLEPTQDPFAKCPPTYIYENFTQLVSPNFPFAYDANMECAYFLYGRSAMTIAISFEEVYLGSDDSISLMDINSGTIVASTGTNIKQGSLIRLPYKDVLMLFKSGTNYDLFARWRVTFVDW